MDGVSLEQFLHSPARSLLTYPQSELAAARIDELQALGITKIYNYGAVRLQHWHCLGLGYFGLVLLVEYQGQLTALKVRRSDASRASFEQEAAMLRLANTKQIGPKLQGVSQDFLLMDYVAGPLFVNWLKADVIDNVQTVHDLVLNLLQQAFQLDQLGLDHGNLRCVTAHVIVSNNQPILLDFSSASTTRRPANITTLIQGLFWGTSLVPLLQQYGLQLDRETAIPLLRSYKQQPSAENFEQLLNQIFGARSTSV
ncbi:hypothetical protein [Romeriopsis navalis]|nr:hypothetical protein [Romeriopsis navalis]